MKFKLLNELVDNGYDGKDLDELYEFAIDFIEEYKELVEGIEVSKSAVQKLLNARKRKGLNPKTSAYMKKYGISLSRA